MSRLSVDYFLQHLYRVLYPSKEFGRSFCSTHRHCRTVSFPTGAPHRTMLRKAFDLAEHGDVCLIEQQRRARRVQAERKKAPPSLRTNEASDLARHLFPPDFGNNVDSRIVIVKMTNRGTQRNGIWCARFPPSKQSKKMNASALVAAQRHRRRTRNQPQLPDEGHYLLTAVSCQAICIV